MSALMFIFIIALAASVLSLRQQEQKFREDQRRLAGTTEARRQLMDEIRRLLREGGETRIEIDADNGVIRFGEAILFDSGRADVKVEGIAAIARLRRVLEAVLPCYAEARPDGCSGQSNDGTVDAVFVEGHTDRVRIQPGGRYSDNWELSAARARTVYQQLMRPEAAPEEAAVAPDDLSGPLGQLKNGQQQSIFSISGYADRRPVDADRLEANRRIDLRFVMVPPRELLLPAPAVDTRDRMRGQ
jgi:flagellar motor protein MotB